MFSFKFSLGSPEWGFLCIVPDDDIETEVFDQSIAEGVDSTMSLLRLYQLQSPHTLFHSGNSGTIWQLIAHFGDWDRDDPHEMVQDQLE